MKHPAAYLLTLLLGSMTGASEIAPADLRPVVEACAECHDGSSAKGGLDITSLKFHMNDQSVRDRWMQIQRSRPRYWITKSSAYRVEWAF